MLLSTWLYSFKILRPFLKKLKQLQSRNSSTKKAVVDKKVASIKKLQSQPSKELVRKDVTNIAIQEGLTLVVYWKVLNIGKGPAVILKVYNREILKFDCFGKEKGHYHVYPNYNDRIWFIEDNAADQVRRTRLELEMNGSKYLRKYLSDFPKNPKLRHIDAKLPDLGNALDQMEDRMNFFLSNIPELKEI